MPPVQVDSEVLQSPVFIRSQQLTYELKIFGLCDTDQEDWKIDSPSPPATLRSARRPSGVNSATHSSVPSHGMFGWFQVSQLKCVPEGLTRGDA